jgi:hypothetical protein
LTGSADSGLATDYTRNVIIVGHVVGVACVLNTTFDNNRVAACFTLAGIKARTIVEGSIGIEVGSGGVRASEAIE